MPASDQHQPAGSPGPRLTGDDAGAAGHPMHDGAQLRASASRMMPFTQHRGRQAGEDGLERFTAQVGRRWRLTLT